MYRHICGGEVIYIGVGKPGREKDYCNRSIEWKQLTFDKEIISEIIWETLDRKEAYKKEEEFISLYGRRDLNGGSLINKTNGGGWLKGFKWTEDKKQVYSERAKESNNLAKYIKEFGSPNKEKSLGKRPDYIVQKSKISLKKSWLNKDEKTAFKQAKLFREDNPSHKIKYCDYCERDIQGASAFKRFHGINCKKYSN